MPNESMIDVALDILNKKGSALKFADLWGEVKARLGITPEEEANKIGHFYSDLSLDARFHALPDNVWDLRSRYTYEQCKVETGAFYSEVEESDNDEADKQDEAEYNAAMSGSVIAATPLPEDEESEDSDGEERKTDGADLLGIPTDKVEY